MAAMICCSVDGSTIVPKNIHRKILVGANILYLYFKKQEKFNVFYEFCLFKMFLNNKMI